MFLFQLRELLLLLCFGKIDYSFGIPTPNIALKVWTAVQYETADSSSGLGRVRQSAAVGRSKKLKNKFVNWISSSHSFWILLNNFTIIICYTNQATNMTCVAFFPFRPTIGFTVRHYFESIGWQCTDFQSFWTIIQQFYIVCLHKSAFWYNSPSFTIARNTSQKIFISSPQIGSNLHNVNS